jgi:hypothetical protein
MSAMFRMGFVSGVGLVLMLLAVAAPAMASGATVPEIDGSSVSAGLGLLASAGLVLRSRKR